LSTRSFVAARPDRHAPSRRGQSARERAPLALIFVAFVDFRQVSPVHKVRVERNNPGLGRAIRHANARLDRQRSCIAEAAMILRQVAGLERAASMQGLADWLEAALVALTPFDEKLQIETG
jgi:hypothetical protein